MSEGAVGVVGLGAMGLGIAGSLLRKGIAVRGCDVVEANREALRKAGGEAFANPAEATNGLDVLFVVVVNAEQTESVLFGENGAAAALAPKAAVALCPTIAPGDMRRLCARVAEAGLLPLDAPMSGGAAGARDGRLIIMGAGCDAAFAKAERAFAAVTARVYRLGSEPGLGTMAKVAHQLLAGVNLATACEAMAFATRLGCDPEVFFDIARNSAGQSWMLEDRVPPMLDDNWEPKSAVEIFVKDLGLVLEAAKAERFPLPLAGAAHQLFLAASAMGVGRENDGAVVKVYEKLSGISVRRRKS